MKRNWIAALACLAMLAALGGCNLTGGVDDSVTSPSPSASGAGHDYSGNLPNNAGGSANNPGNSPEPGTTGSVTTPRPSGGVTTPGTTGGSDEVGTGMIGDSGIGADDDARHTTPGGSGNYSADNDGSVDGTDPGGRMRSVGDDLRSMADSAGRAIRDIM